MCVNSLPLERTQDKRHWGLKAWKKLSGALPLAINWCINDLSEGVGPTVLNSQNCRDAWACPSFRGRGFRDGSGKIKKKVNYLFLLFGPKILASVLVSCPPSKKKVLA